jgi:MYXO-CTERM domain-containing protein
MLSLTSLASGGSTRWTRVTRILSPALAAAGLLSVAAPALAFCRTRGCDEDKSLCPRDLHGCGTVGEFVYWPNGEAELWVDSEGSPLWNVSAADASAALARAVAHWTDVTCPDGRPLQLSMTLPGLLSSSDAQVEDNVLSFFDENSPYHPDVVGKTRIQFAVDSGALYYVDIDVNSQHHEVVVSPETPDQIDLEAMLTHEVGHFFGLDHSDVPGATMQPGTMETNGVDLRTLEPDDIEGICAIYAEGNLPLEPEPSAPEASDSGGCSVAPGPASDTQGAGYGLLLCVGLLARRRRRGSR